MSRSNLNPPLPSAPFQFSVLNNINNHSSNNSNANDFLTQEEKDEIYARRLQEEEERAAQLRTTGSPPSASASSSSLQNTSGRSIHQEPTVGVAGGRGEKKSSDEEVARQVEREMQDEIYARQLQQIESQSRNRRQSNSRADPRIMGTASEIARIQHNSQQRNTSSCSKERWCSAAVMLVIVAGAAILVLLYGSSIWDRMGSTNGSKPPFFSWDETNSTTEIFKNWKTNGKGGLSLSVVNAMSVDWDQYFDESTADWNQAPALSLTLEWATPDPECSHIPGKLKCCNDYYGLLGWSGLNEAYIDSRGDITASTAKMNESYLNGKGYAEKRYVACHEIGHGFGLPHRDTSINNPDLGTCLDYTTSFSNNMRPDQVDFMNLQTLYGSTPTGERRSLLRNNDVNYDHNKRRPVSVEEAHTKKEVEGLSSPSRTSKKNRSYKDGRLLFKSESKEIYEENLSDGGKIITTLLLARAR